MNRIGWLVVLAAVVAVAAPRARAQMFGDRQLGGFLGRQNTPSAMSNPAEGLLSAGGMLNGNERFLRSNRGSGTFVGNDSRGSQGFIGATQARERRTTPAAATAREKKRPNVNQMLQGEPLSRDGIYAPRLVLSPSLSGPMMSAVAESLEAHLARAGLNGSARCQ